MKFTRQQLQKLLVDSGYISQEDFNNAFRDAKRRKHELADTIVENGLIKDDQLGQLLAQEAGFPFVNLRVKRIEQDVLHLVPEIVARSKGIIAFQRDKNEIKVGMIDPDDLEIQHFLEKKSGESVVAYFITKGDLEEALTHYSEGFQTEFFKLLQTLENPAVPREERDTIVVDMVNRLIRYGHQNKASDIHIEPLEDNIGVRIRVDGVLHDVLTIPKNLGDLILSRIKILAKMRTDERRAAQDGRYRFTTTQETVDVRVSVVPITHGENVVMRLLSARNRQFTISDLGLSESDLNKITRAIEQPHGMVLVTGPTGSGKTTTVYAIMKIINKRSVHISTIEDPVEYDIEGISQIQVNPKTNLTFASGLRAIVRQDPDIILVGEVRDKETAGIAINSAMTGHLVLSTLHANDAATTLPRLLDMDIEPFLVASTVNVVVAQRLVRKICVRCRESYALTQEEKRAIHGELAVETAFTKKGIKKLDTLRLYRGAGCKVCGNTGYAGRVGVFEVMEMNSMIKSLIMTQSSSDTIQQAAVKSGMTTLLEGSIEKILNGTTTLEEVLRVTKE